MTTMIIIFAGLILLAGIVLLINPQTIFGFLKSHANSSAIHVIAVLTRLIVGAFLIAQSGVSKYPLAMEVLGWILVVAGLALAAIGGKNFRTLMSWVLTKFKPFGRLAGVVAIVFGGFLVYSFV